MSTLTIGHDSEFGISKEGKLLSALDHIKEYEGDAGRYFPDNLNTEIAINPASSLVQFHSFTEDLLNRIKDQGYDLVMEPMLCYPDEALGNPLAYISGCNPDYSAYTMTKNESPDFQHMDGTRSLGGHIHAGDSTMDIWNWSRWMDLLVGLPLLLVEQPNNRREMYGGAGAMREKPYGAEYRSLSNVWVNSKHLREFVWEGTHRAVEMCKKGDSRKLENWSDIPMAIDSGNRDLAQRTIDRLYLTGVQNVT